MTPDEISWKSETLGLLKALPRVEEKIDALTEKLDSRPCVDHEQRLRAVEKAKWIRWGQGTIIGAILTWLGTKV